jgi:aubergine
MRKAFIRSKADVLGGHLYDGASILYLTKRLPDAETDFDVVSREGTTYKITIKCTDTVIQMTDGMAVQVLNTILKRAMDGLKMQLVGRNMYDAGAPVRIPQFKIDLWPGKI